MLLRDIFVVTLSLAAMPLACASAPGSASGGAAAATAGPHAGEIVFSTQAIAEGPVDDKALAGSFPIDQPIHWRAYFQKPALEIMRAAGGSCDSSRDHNGSGYAFSIQGRRAGSGDDAWKTLDEKGARSTFEGATTASWGQLTGAPGEGDTGALQSRFVPFVAEAPPGPVKIELRLMGSCDDESKPGTSVKKAHAELAKGTLEVIVSEQGLASAGGQTNPKLNPVAMANKDDFKNIQAAAQSLVGEKKLVDIVTFAADWNVQKNPLGVPVTRTIAGAFIMKDGNRCKQYEYRAVQEHQGGGRYTDVPVFKNAYGNPLDIRSAGVVIVCP